MARHLLTELAVRKAKPGATAYRLADGEGLYLYVPASGVKSWQYRYRHDGKPQTATLGKLSVMDLATARARADAARKLAADGEHVTVAKRVEKARRATSSASTFKSLAERWVAHRARRERWTPDYRDEVEASLRNHLSALDGLPVSEITASMVAPHLETVEAKSPDMARKVEQRLLAIMNYAVRHGLVKGNPIPPPERRSKKGADGRRHLSTVLDRKEVGAILRAADVAEISRGVRRAHLLAAFTVQRIGEIVPAVWSEFDFEEETWTIPRARMKRKDEERGPHIVPLPPRLLAMLRDWRRADGEDAVHVCPAPKGDGPIARESVEKFYRRTLGMSGKHSPHSWRSVFSTWAADAGKDGNAIEQQLDHAIGTKQAQAYDRAKRVEYRRELIAWHEGQMLSARDGGEVVPLHVDVAGRQ